MRRFYEHVQVDRETLQFSAQCPICGKMQYGLKLPFRLRSIRTLAKCEKGTAGKIRQRVYNHAKSNSVQVIAMLFNQCRHCYRWVCDDCYDISDPDGTCRECMKQIFREE